MFPPPATRYPLEEKPTEASFNESQSWTAFRGTLTVYSKLFTTSFIVLRYSLHGTFPKIPNNFWCV
jgi:hypothetical protein